MHQSKYLSLSIVIILFILCSACKDNSPDERPNILIIMTDQQSADVMSYVMGNDYINTPNMDYLAENGVLFPNAYSPTPLCMPMRTSMITGQFPHYNNVLRNNKEFQIDPDRNVFMGKIFKDAGYKTAYFGKWHVAFDVERREVHGFDSYQKEGELIEPNAAVDFLKADHEKPFLAVTSFLGPHEVCQWSRRQELPGDQLEEPTLDELPPLRANHLPPENETDIMTQMRTTFQQHRLFPLADYNENDWRRLEWGYYRLVERVDASIGKLLDALRESGKEENTLIVFLSDHGDCSGSHSWNQKIVFYDESARVPFIITQVGKTKKMISDQLVNVGLDVIPTICSFAGIEVPGELPGLSVKPVVDQEKTLLERDYVISENHLVHGEPVQPYGRMVRSQRYKYCLYSEGMQRESLVDMVNDPGETVNQATNPELRDILSLHRTYLQEHAREHNDTTALEMLKYVEIEE